MPDLRTSVVIGARLSRSFDHSLTRARRSVGRVGQSIASTNRAAASIRGYRVLEGRLAATSERFAAARATTARLRGEMRITRTPSRELAAAFDAARTRSTRLGQAVDRQTRALARHRRELRGAGVDVRRMDAEERRLGRTLRRQAQLRRSLTASTTRYQAALERRRGLHGRIFGAAATAYAVGRPIQATLGGAISLQSGMADAAKVMDFDSPEERRNMRREIQKLTTRGGIPLRATEVADIVAEGAQAGIEKDQLVEFAGDAARVAVAFDIEAGEAGDQLAGLRNIFKLEQDGVMDVAGAYNFLSNNMAARAKDLLDIANRVGGTADIYGITGQQLGALGATLLALKSPPEVASTAVRAMMLRLGTAENQTDEFREALDELGFDAEDFAERMNTGDAQGAILELLEAIEGSGDQRSSFLERLFGMEYAGELAKIVSSMDLCRGALVHIRSEEARAISVQREFDARAGTTDNRLQLLANRWQRMSDNIGFAFLPAIDDAAEGVGDYIEKAGDWAEQNPETTRTLVAVAGALVALKVASIGARFASASLAASWHRSRMRLTAFRRDWRLMTVLMRRSNLFAATGQTRSLGRALRGAAVGARVFGRALWSIGGPIGAIWLAVDAVMAFSGAGEEVTSVLEDLPEHVDLYGDSIEELTRKLEGLTAAQVEHLRNQKIAEAVRLREELAEAEETYRKRASGRIGFYAQASGDAGAGFRAATDAEVVESEAERDRRRTALERVEVEIDRLGEVRQDKDEPLGTSAAIPPEHEEATAREFGTFGGGVQEALQTPELQAARRGRGGDAHVQVTTPVSVTVTTDNPDAALDRIGGHVQETVELAVDRALAEREADDGYEDDG
ncbi:MAG: phage tail tape measure protein [Acidobacteria bacterium]|nr:phage tail tape measure protein [Acidobacteriota bacterium]